jgi:hypothetical protein
VARNVTCDLTAAGRVANVDGILQIEMRSKRYEVIGVVIHIVSVGGLA